MAKIKVKKITKEEQFQLNKERFNAYQCGVGAKRQTPKHPDRKDLKKDLKLKLKEEY